VLVLLGLLAIAVVVRGARRDRPGPVGGAEDGRRQLSPFWQWGRLWGGLAGAGVLSLVLGAATGHPAEAWLGVAFLAAGAVVAGLAHRYAGR